MKCNENIYRGYWPQILNSDSTDFMMDEYESTDMSAYDFLHGSCAFFAYTLAKKFGYDIILAYTLDPEYVKNFTHAYCYTTIDGRECYFDIRGITTDEDMLLEEFEIFLTHGGDDWVSLEPITCEEMDSCKFLNGHGKENILENAEKFIEANIDYYRL